MSKASQEACVSLEELACQVAGYFDIAKASDEDAINIFGRDDPDDAADKLLACGAAIVIITAGAKGAFVYTRSCRRLVPPSLCNLVDTTGGGDTFMAGFLSEYLRSADPVSATRWGCATAACVIEQTGGVRVERMPTHAQVAERIQVSSSAI